MIYIIEWKDPTLEGWKWNNSKYFRSETEAHRFAQRWYRLYAEETEQYHIIRLEPNYLPKNCF